MNPVIMRSGLSHKFAKKERRLSWFWRGVFVATVAHSVMAVGDLKTERLPVWSESSDVIQLADMPLFEPVSLLSEFELDDNSPSADQTPTRMAPVNAGEAALVAHSPESSSLEVTRTLPLSDAESIVDPPAGFSTKPTTSEVQPVVSSSEPSSTEAAPLTFVHASQLAGATADLAAPETGVSASKVELSDIPVEFPSDVPASEIARVSQTFRGLIQENLRAGPYVLSERFAGTVYGGEVVSNIDTEEVDEPAGDAGFIIGQDVDDSVEFSGLDPFKTYTVVNGRICAVTPADIARVVPASASANLDRVVSSETKPTDISRAEQQDGSATSAKAPIQTEELNASRGEMRDFELPREEVNKGLSEVTPQVGVASLDGNSLSSESVTVAGVVRVPEGFAKDKVFLRLAGTAFQVQTNAAGHFELRDVPKGTRFELLVWHLDGGLTRRLIPVSASARSEEISIELVKTTYVDSLAQSFGLMQQMNLGGFCARVDVENTTALVGASVYSRTAERNLAVHYFSEQGLPASSLTELTRDGRFCVFNVEEALVDVKLVTLSGLRRQFAVHVEPSTFEHDLVLDASQSMYRRVSLLEPLDSRAVIELTAQGVQPDYGDNRLRQWMFGDDTPTWKRVSNYVLKTDGAYAAVRPNPDDLQFFPGGQEFVEVRVAPDIPNAPWARILLSRDELFTEAMLRQAEEIPGRVFQDKMEPFKVAALDADAWEEIAANNPELPSISQPNIGGVYLSVDTSALGYEASELNISVRDTWTGETVCDVMQLNPAKEIKASRFFRAVCGAKSGQFALIVQSSDGALLWSDVVRIRAGTVQTVTVAEQKR